MSVSRLSLIFSCFMLTALFAKAFGKDSGFVMLDKLFSLIWAGTCAILSFLWKNFAPFGGVPAGKAESINMQDFRSSPFARSVRPYLENWIVLCAIFLVVYICCYLLITLCCGSRRRPVAPKVRCTRQEFLDAVNSLAEPGVFSSRADSAEASTTRPVRSRSPLHKRLDALEYTSRRTAIAVQRMFATNPTAMWNSLVRTPQGAQLAGDFVEWVRKTQPVVAADILGDISDLLQLADEDPVSTDPSPPARGGYGGPAGAGLSQGGGGGAAPPHISRGRSLYTPLGNDDDASVRGSVTVESSRGGVSAFNPYGGDDFAARDSRGGAALGVGAGSSAHFRSHAAAEALGGGRFGGGRGHTGPHGYPRWNM